jgi:hypothetical protein
LYFSFLRLSVFPSALLVGLSLAAFPTGLAQSAKIQDQVGANEAAVMKLRDDFTTQVTHVGVKCPIGLPKLLFQNVKSWGNYDPDKNTLTTPLWGEWGDDEKSIFTRLAGPNATEEAAHAEFEMGIHHWVFVHEMGHWTQTCRNLNRGQSHYSIEYGANRIALAWRKRDPAVAEHMIAVFQSVLKNRPSPVPQGQSVEAFFNENYEQLAGTSAYTWFQAEMVDAASKEQPAPSFLRTVTALR